MRCNAMQWKNKSLSSKTHTHTRIYTLFSCHHIVSKFQTTAVPKAVGRYLFDRIRDLKTIEQFLTATYSRREAFTDELVRTIPTFLVAAAA